MPHRAKRHRHEPEDRIAQYNDHQIIEAQKILARIWGACEKACRKNGRHMPAIEFVIDNADSFERAAHLVLGAKLVLICRSQLIESNRPASGFTAELVISEKTGSLVGVSKVAVAYATLTKQWTFYCNAGIGRSEDIMALLGRLGIEPQTRAIIAKPVAVETATGLVDTIAGWAALRLPKTE